MSELEKVQCPPSNRLGQLSSRQARKFSSRRIGFLQLRHVFWSWIAASPKPRSGLARTLDFISLSLFLPLSSSTQPSASARYRSVQPIIDLLVVVVVVVPVVGHSGSTGRPPHLASHPSVPCHAPRSKLLCLIWCRPFASRVPAFLDDDGGRILTHDKASARARSFVRSPITTQSPPVQYHVQTDEMQLDSTPPSLSIASHRNDPGHELLERVREEA